MKKRALCLFAAMAVLLLPVLLASCNDPNYMGSLPPAGTGAEEGGEALSDDAPPIPDLTPPAPSDEELYPSRDQESSSPSSYLPTPSDSVSNDEEDGEPEEKYSDAWLEWLVHGAGDRVYKKVLSNTVFSTSYKEGMASSGFEIWPRDGDGSIYEDTRFHLRLAIDHDEFDGTTDINTDEYPYRWMLFYREEGQDGAYLAVEVKPWGFAPLMDKNVYRLNIHDYGQVDMHLKEDGSANTYQTVIVIVNDREEIVLFMEQSVEWNESSEAYYQDALKLGVIGEG